MICWKNPLSLFLFKGKMAFPPPLDPPFLLLPLWLWFYSEIKFIHSWPRRTKTLCVVVEIIIMNEDGAAEPGSMLNATGPGSRGVFKNLRRRIRIPQTWILLWRGYASNSGGSYSRSQIAGVPSDSVKATFWLLQGLPVTLMTNDNPYIRPYFAHLSVTPNP